MLTKIQKWGNSQGLRLARHVLDDVRLGIGDEVDVQVRDGVIVIAPASHIRGNIRLEDLVAKISEGRSTDEIDWGTPAGGEEW